MSKVINSTEKDFKKTVLDSKLPVLVDFWAPWCAPCRAMAPALDELSEELADRLKIVKVNVEEPENMALGHQYQIRSIPNMKLFKNGAVAKEFIGLRPKEVLEQELKSFL